MTDADPATRAAGAGVAAGAGAVASAAETSGVVAMVVSESDTAPRPVLPTKAHASAASAGTAVASVLSPLKRAAEDAEEELMEMKRAWLRRQQTSDDYDD
jgi:hypothetical protein